MFLKSKILAEGFDDLYDFFIQNSLRKVRNKGERQHLRQEIKQLRKELRQREEAAVKEIFQKSQVVLATLTMTSEDGPLGGIDKRHFDLVVIDECSQVCII